MSEAVPFNNMDCSGFEPLISSTSIGNMTNYSIKRGNTESTKKTIYVKDTDYTVADDFKTAVTGKHYVCELNTPVTVQLDPQTIRTLAGANTVWSNANGDIEIKYIKKG